MTITARDTTFDIAKGIGIILVVIGHSQIVLREWKEVFIIIFSFHMPLFFFLSGLFIRRSNAIRQTIISKTDGLLKPYLSAALIFGVGLAIAGRMGPEKYIAGVFYGTGQTLCSLGGFPLVPLWFLPHLFVSVLTCFLILKIFNNVPRQTSILTIICFVALSFGAWAMGHFTRGFPFPSIVSYVVTLGNKSHTLHGLPFSLDLIPVTVGFILAGAIVARDSTPTPFKLPAFLAAGASFCALHYFFNETIDLNQRSYGSFLICTAQAFLGIYITLSISRVLSKSGVPARYLAYIGQSSLFIMIFHVAIMSSSRKLLPSGYSELLLSSFTILAGLFGPLILLEFVRRYRFLSLVFLPSKSKSSIKNLTIQ